MKRVREYGQSISGINITPIIDITLVLLIIMLVAAPVLNIPNMNVELPEAYTSETKQQNVSVSLGTDLRVALDENIVRVEDLAKRLDAILRKKPNAMVIIRADKDVDYENVENLIETIKTRTRAKKIAVATKQKTVSAGEQ